MVNYALQQLMNGICQGSIYALMAIGYTMIYGVVGLVSFSYGELVMIGGFGAYYTFVYSGNFFLGVIGGFMASAVWGIVLYILCYKRFLEAPRHISMICTFAFSMMTKNLAQIVFGSEPKAVPSVFENVTYTILGIRITTLQMIIISVVIVFAICFTLFLTKTRAGTMLRAVSQNKKASALMGINVQRTVLIGNGIGCALGGVAGVLLILYYASCYPNLGQLVGNKALTSTVLGGLVSIAGSALGGLSIGILENLGIMFIPVGFRDVITFIFLVIVLIFRPKGLFVRKGTR